MVVNIWVTTRTDAVIHKQSAWNRLGVSYDLVSVKSGLVTSVQKASFLAAASPHSGDWLYAFPNTSCGLRLDEESIHVAASLRLGSNVCVPHTCGCGTYQQLACFHLQESSWSNRQTSGSERRRRTGVCVRRFPGHQGARRVGKAGWQATRRPVSILGTTSWLSSADQSQDHPRHRKSVHRVC